MLEQPQFGQRLKALRVKRGLSQAELAGDFVSTGYLSRLESGARPPTQRVVDHLAERLGVSETAFAVERGSSLARVLASATSADSTDVEALRAALDGDEESTPELRWQAMWLLAAQYSRQGAFEQEFELLGGLETLTAELDVPELYVRTHAQLSRCARILGYLDKARDYAVEAVDRASSVGLFDRAAALHALISADAETGRLAESREHAELLVTITDGTPGTAAVKARWALATVAMRQGDRRAAQEALEHALRGLDSHDDLQLWVRLRLAVASLSLQSNPPDVETARVRLAEVGSVIVLVGTDLHQQEKTALQAHLAFACGRHDEARALSAAAAEHAERLSFRDRIRLLALQGRLRIVDGDVEGGAAALRRLADEAQEAHNFELASDVWRGLAEALGGPSGDRPTAGGR